MTLTNVSRGQIFVTLNICVLTFSIYIGSAIYTSGLSFIVPEFNTSSTVATLGLTLYVIGYGVGPMIWVSLRITEPMSTQTANDR